MKMSQKEANLLILLIETAAMSIIKRITAGKTDEEIDADIESLTEEKKHLMTKLETL